MSPKGKHYRPEYAKELLAIAAGDLASANGLAKINEGRPENICYMAQQCVEKSLKAVLCFTGKLVLHSHDLDALASHLPEGQLPPRMHQLGALTEYSMIRRYEEGYEILERSDILLALELAAEVLVWAKGVCGLRP